MHRLLIALLLATTARAVDLGPELRVAPQVVREASGDQRDAAIAAAGSSSLVVWWDYERQAMYSATIAADGIVSMPGTRLANGIAAGISLCWTGSMYLATWYDVDGVRAIALHRDGTAAGSAQLIASKALTHAGSLAWNGDRALLAYEIEEGGPAQAALLDPNANVLRASIPRPGNGWDAAVAAAGSDFYVFDRYIHVDSTFDVFRIADDGTPQGTTATPIAMTKGTAEKWGVAYDGNRFAVVAVESNANQMLRRFLFDPRTLAVSALPAVAVNAPSGAAVVWNGSAFITVWTDYGATPSYALDTMPFTESSSGPIATILSGSGTIVDPIATYDGSDVVIGWKDGGDLRAAHADAAAAQMIAAPFTISTAPAPQLTPAVAPGLTVWTEPVTDTTYDVFASVGGARMRLSTSSAVAPSIRPAAVLGGSMYFVVWQEASGLVGRRIGTNGALLDAAPLSLGSGTHPALAFNGSEIVLAFIDGAAKAQHFDRGGNATGAPQLLAPGTAQTVSIAANGDEFLAAIRTAWQTILCCGEAPIVTEVHGVALARIHGTAVDASVLRAPPSMLGAADFGPPALAANGDGYVVLFATGTHMTAQRVSRTATPGPLEDLGDLAWPVADVAAGADAAGTWLAWRTFAGDLRLAHFGAAGIDAPPQTIASAATSPAFATGVIAYSRSIDPDATVVVLRALPGRAHGHAARR